MRLGNREILRTYTCHLNPVEHWHGSVISKIPGGTKSEGNGLCMTTPRALWYLVTGK